MGRNLIGLQLAARQQDPKQKEPRPYGEVVLPENFKGQLSEQPLELKSVEQSIRDNG